MIVEIPDNDSNIKDLISREDLIRTIKTECNPYGAPTIDCVKHTITSNFELWCDEFEEYYINKYTPTRVTINWYKGAHLGRTNTCTDPNFTLQDFREFLMQLKKELFYEVD